MHFCILGSQPAISQAEIYSVLSDIKNERISGKMFCFDSNNWNNKLLMDILGGTVKLGEIIYDYSFEQFNPASLADLIAPNFANKEGKRSLDFGLTVYGSNAEQKKLFKLPIQLKKELRSRGYSVRWVTGKGGEPLSPAAVAKCKLTISPNIDLCIAINNNKIIIGKTTQVQDADSWSKRDYDRPKRDSKNGMLPPKLARMMVNLACLPDKGILLDPFCGCGTIIMEAALATNAKQIIGSDIESKQIDYTDKNNNWLLQEQIFSKKDIKQIRTFVADVRNLKNFIAPHYIDAVVTEGYLGPPLQGDETQKELDSNAKLVLELWLDALRALKPLLKPSASLVVATPLYRTSRGHSRVSLSNHLDSLGYTENVYANELVYSRENQFVARKISFLHLK